ncbi:3'(2'), 5'-bisphosphate nucleotidase [Methylophilaceae bacterium]|nr:3'(2'), 5'-bisphosphate nucleotidase [Methylophilaceae bacterium]
MIARPDWLAEVVAIARKAGDAIMQVYAGDIDVEQKSDDSPLTQADLAAHHLIEAGLQRFSPRLPVLSEESAAIPYEVRCQWPQYWLVDPLDGTREFIKRNGEFTVNIALIQGNKAVLGVVYAPAMDLLYYADTNGAYKKDGKHPARAIQARPLNFQDIVIAGSRSHSDARLQRFIGCLEKKLSGTKLISMGSSLKICMVAEGAADVYPRLGPTSEWDTAAAQCILENAGGRLTDTQGNTLLYNSKASLLNPEFFASGATAYDWQQYLE